MIRQLFRMLAGAAGGLLAFLLLVCAIFLGAMSYIVWTLGKLTVQMVALFPHAPSFAAMSLPLKHVMVAFVVAAGSAAVLSVAAFWRR